MRKIKFIHIIIAVIIIVVLAFAINYYRNISNSTFEWNIFKNTEFKYSFEYPTSTKIYLFSDKGEDIELNSETATSTIVNVFEKYPSGHLFQVFAENLPALSDNLEISYINQFYPNSTKTPAHISGINGYKVSMGHSVYFLEKNRIIYVIDLISTSTLSEQILKTFKTTK